MGWFEKQIKARKEYDDGIFEESFLEIASSILGRQFKSAFEDDSLQMRNAMERVLKYYHIPIQKIPDNAKSVSEQIEHLTQPYGIMRRNVKLSSGWYKDAFGAMLGIRQDTGEAVALIPNKVRGYHYFDSSLGKDIKINAKNEKLFNETAIAFYIPFPSEKIDIKSMAKYIIKAMTASDVAVIAAMMLIATLLGMVMPMLNKWLFMSVILTDEARPLIAVAVFMVCVSISKVLIEIMKAFTLVRLGTKLHTSVEAAVMARIISLPTSVFKKYSAGDLASRSEYISAICDLIVNTVFTTGITGIFSLMYIIQIFSFTPSLAAPAIITILLIAVLSVISSLVQISVSKKRLKLASAESGLSYSLISGIQKIKLSGSEKRAFSKWGKLYSKVAALKYNPPTIIKVSPVLCTGVSLIGTIVIYYFAVNNNVGISDFYAFNTSYGLVSGAILTLSGITLSLAEIKPMLEMCLPIMETLPETAEQKHVIDRLTGSIEVNHLSFRYSDDLPLIIDDLSLKIRPGEYVAIVGTTGCGKSTLMRLLLGFEKPKKGAIFYDGKNMETIDLKSLRRKIGTVLQEGKLFQGDIFSNITISAPWLTMDDAWEAAEISGMAEDIRNMPMGMFTIISEGQGGISGGQRQRLMIARAVAPKPRVLMFDEATSALDNITQKTVSDSLAKMKCTRIVIAHRLSTIKQCDRIIFLDKGHILEEGTYDELISQNGHFAELVERQRIDK